MITIGVGNTGCKLALMFDKSAMLLSTAEQDTNNFAKENKVLTFSDQGAAKRFNAGIKIWEDNAEKLRYTVRAVTNEKVIIFSSLGGGSGSSSLYPLSSVLIEQGCKILIAAVMPYKKEINPPLANAVQSLNALMPVIDKVSVMVFDNEKLLKEYENDWTNINNHIVMTVDYVVNLLSKYSTDDYSPVTLDQSELESVIFGGGFLDMSDSFLEETPPKFEYGSLDKETKNCLFCMFVNTDIKDADQIDSYQNRLTDVIRKYSTRVTNARLIPGILRAQVNFTNSSNPNITDRAYVTIASGLSIDRYLKKLEKVKDEALKRAEVWGKHGKGAKILKTKDKSTLDI